MRTVLGIGMLLALAGPLGAESYSWIDDNGTYNFTEDYAQVPRKYRKKVTRRGDLSPEQTETPAGGGEKSTAAEPAGSRAAGKSGQGAAGTGQLPGGRAEESWRSELNLHELELRRLEALLDDQQREAKAPGGISRERLAVLAREREETRTEYNRKYRAYLDLLESARKAGFSVEMKK